MPDKARKWLDDFLGATYTSYSEALDDVCAVVRRLLAANKMLEGELAGVALMDAEGDEYARMIMREKEEAEADRAALVAYVRAYKEYTLLRTKENYLKLCETIEALSDELREEIDAQA